MFLDCLAKNYLGEAIRVDLVKFTMQIKLKKRNSMPYVGSVKRVDSVVVRKLDVLDTLLLTKNPVHPFGRAVAHTPQDDSGDLESRLTQSH